MSVREERLATLFDVQGAIIGGRDAPAHGQAIEQLLALRGSEARVEGQEGTPELDQREQHL
jgi:hypothetical protein